MQTVRRARVILGARKGNIPLLIILAQAIFAALSAHTSLFSSIAALITTLGTQTTDLVNAQNGVKNKTVGSADRNAKRDLVVTTLESIRAAIQSLCDGSPEQAASFIQSAGMKVAAFATRSKAMLAATLGVQSGVVDLVANGSLLTTSRRRRVFNWQYTLDQWKKDGTTSPFRRSPSAPTFCLRGSP
jgi:hypothetical protein